VNTGRILDECVFCRILRGELPASLVCEDEDAAAFVDLRQSNPGHVLVVPRRHLADVRELDGPTGAALMAMIVRVTRAVGEAFPNEGLSLWHSIGEAGFQEVPHLHVHVHPRRIGDELFRLYPTPPLTPERATLERIAEAIRARL
jgi:histidine triad (HIT) family protein